MSRFYSNNYAGAVDYDDKTVNALSAATYGIIALDTVAAMYALDVSDDIEESEYMKHRDAKRFLFKIRNGYKKLRVELAVRMAGKQRQRILEDFGNIIFGEVEKDISKLQYSIANVLAKAGFTDTMFRAKILTALALCDLACSFVEQQERTKFVRLDDKHVLDVKKMLHPLKIEETRYGIKSFKDLICEDKGLPDVNLNDDANCKLASKIIINKLGDSKIIKNALDKATEINSETN